MSRQFRQAPLARTLYTRQNGAHLARILGLLASATAFGCIDRPVAETTPETHNVFLTQTRLSKVDKIDILFMIDNSLSMADKQQVLGAAVPQLLRRLTSPDCVNRADKSAAPVPMDNPSAACENPGYEREFAPVNDIHIGVVTSSLGDYGGNGCDTGSDDPVTFKQARDDHAWLLGSLPRTSGTLSSPFLTWAPGDARDFGSRIGPKESEFRDFVTAAGEHGCGFEMSLESWYRFLVDPEPPKRVDLVEYPNGGHATVRGEVDRSILDQRSRFLRPDSLLAIVMLTDENDCSLKDSGASFLVGSGSTLQGGSAACKDSPNDPCCYSCDFEKPPAGCAAEANCTGPTPTADVSNLRCFHQKQRYGYDYLFPTSRYVNALRLQEICPYQNYGSLDCDCKEEKARGIQDCVGGKSFKNPLFDPASSENVVGLEPRKGPEMVFLAGIVGVPWQDVAEPDTLESGKDLRYRLASKLDWDLILPRADGTQAADPLMREQIEPRNGTHPITNEPIGLPTSSKQRQLNQINWHDFDNGGGELQYACVFDLSQPLSDKTASNALPGSTRDCDATCSTDDEACLDSQKGCPCKAALADPKDKNSPMVHPQSPLCQATDGSYGGIQTAAKAYPGIRELEVLRGHNASAKDNSIVASICPKDLEYSHHQQRGYGYNPAVQALVDRLKTGLSATCLPRQLVPEDGRLPCTVVEAIPPSQAEWTDCDKKQREPVSDSLRGAVLRNMKESHLCDGDSQPSCESFGLCQLKQLADEMHASKPLTKCQNEIGIENTSPVPGFCYVDPSQDMGNKSIVQECPSNRQRMVRIVGNGDDLRAPAPGSWTFVACAGAPYAQKN